MSKFTSRESIIRHGALLVHSRGYNNTGLSDILKAAGVPKGSFYFYFKSKDDFGLALVDYYWEFIRSMAETHCSESGIPPLERLAGFMDAYHRLFDAMGLKGGCPIGNLMQEMSDLSEDFRVKVGDVYASMKGFIAQLLVEAYDRGDLSKAIDPDQTAQFILNSWEGAIMHMKLTKSNEPLRLFKQMVFERILH
ncbi:MAG TPA: TetR family transcriptional regulator C-terminal domain-containing protein [Deltaproteobacteria bacterium]|nr:TetR family transcriptional regulator C-terminal domain-containing protein [Deltaproteobacteria bacterium]HPR56508.1 TetR family transcriptional regulator C-terminal domain-containing protein [Deltaproteobacteria bacterium]HXK46954.1 TetR family transcriptional regulator C-terminal domain-containing protein [Deltaproteobacteria bacterium]